MVNISSQEKKINIKIQSGGVQANVGVTQDTAQFYSEKAREWAISNRIVDGVDYSSKYYAGKANQSASVAEGAKELVLQTKDSVVAEVIQEGNIQKESLKEASEKEQETITEIKNSIEQGKAVYIGESEPVDDIFDIWIDPKDNDVSLSIKEIQEQLSNGSGGGLEIGDIGIAPLGIDETKGKRRYLNGQIVIQEQYIQFTNKLKAAINLYPTLSCSEDEWQKTATMTVGGQVGKFVVDDDAGTIRLPKIIMPIQGLTDLSKLGEIVEAGLPNITGELAQEQIQYPYFIQVATGAETEDKIENEHLLNIPYVLLEPKFFETPVYNSSWLISNGSFTGSKAMHPQAYDALLIELNTNIEVGTTQNNYTKRGLPVKLVTDSYTDEDFVVNPADETFRLPKLTTNRVLVAKKEATAEDLTWYNLYSDGWCEQGGYSTANGNITLLKPYINTNFNVVVTMKSSTNPTVEQGNPAGAVINNATIFVTAGGNKTAYWQAKGYTEIPTQNNNLYFYVGEVAQIPSIVNLGRIEEKLHSLIPDNSSLISGYSMPSNRYIDLTLGASGTPYEAPANGWFCFYTIKSTAGYSYLENTTTGFRTESRTTINNSGCGVYIPARKGDIVRCTYDGVNNNPFWRFYYAEGEV